MHLDAAARAEDFTECGARLVLVDPGEFWYSGMATGMLGGMYEVVDDQVDQSFDRLPQRRICTGPSRGN